MGGVDIDEECIGLAGTAPPPYKRLTSESYNGMSQKPTCIGFSHSNPPRIPLVFAPLECELVPDDLTVIILSRLVFS